MNNDKVQVTVLVNGHLKPDLGREPEALRSIAQSTMESVQEALFEMGLGDSFALDVQYGGDLDPYDLVMQYPEQRVGHVHTKDAHPPDSEAMIRDLVDLLVVNRDLLLSPAVVQSLTDMPALVEQDPSGRLRLRALTTAVNAGLDINEFCMALEDQCGYVAHPKSWDASIEDVIAEQHKGVTVILPKKLDHDLDNLKKEVRAAVFERTGVLISQLELERTEDDDVVTMTLRLNKLTFGHCNIDHDAVGSSITDALIRLVPHLITQDVTNAMLGRFARAFPMVVFSAIDATGTIRVLQVLRELLSERVSVRNLRTILEAVLEIQAVVPPASSNTERVAMPGIGVVVADVNAVTANAEPVHCAEHARYRLGTQLVGSLATETDVPTIKLPDELEQQLDAVRTDPTALGQSKVRITLARWLALQPRTILVTSVRNRRLVSDLIRREFDSWPVLSTAEVAFLPRAGV
jgi:hypothetical protein